MPHSPEEAAFIEKVKTSMPPSLRSFLGATCPIKIVDVGANPVDGPAPYAVMMSSGETQVVGFEPNLAALAKLNSKKGPNELYLPYAVGDGCRHTLRHCRMPGMTSLLEPNQAVLSLFERFGEWAEVTRREEIDTVRLDDVAETSGLDLFKIDIQGGELMVFESATQRLQAGLVIHTEAEFLEMYHGQPLFSDIERFLRGYGYVLHQFVPLVTRDFRPVLLSGDPYVGHSQVMWADAIFVRDFTKLQNLDAEQLLRMAVILHDCYRSFDLVLLLLREHDRRTQQGYGARYAELVRPIMNFPE
jgi:FkbM family methyltransferase